MERRPIPGFPGYEITEDGRVFSWKPKSRNSKPPIVARVLKEIDNNRNYLTVDLMKDGKKYRKTIHCLVLETFVGPPKFGEVACHNDGNSKNNHISNLRWDTRISNEADKKLHKTCNSITKAVNGTKNGQSKLTEEQVIDIRTRYASGIISQKKLAKQFGVSNRLINFIVHRKTWTHI
jgi:hypothetical protein